MVNFGERIAYWYLRLQGFLLTENYVLHRGRDIDHTADTDLVGVRLRHSLERIDRSPLQPDPRFADALNFETKHVVVVAQVKTGISNSPGRAFEVSRLKYSLEFVGAFPTEELDAIVEKLQTNRVVPVGDAWVVGKVLFAEAPEPNCALAVSLDEALEFIEGRLARHRDRKSPDRLSFPDELMQFLAWRGGRSGFGGR